MEEMSKKISKILLSGVLISSTFIIIGILLAIMDNNFIYKHTIYSLQSFFEELSNLNSIAFLMLGIFILILTPIVRIIGMMIEFYFEKNYIYIYISLIVLVILIISLILGITH